MAKSTSKNSPLGHKNYELTRGLPKAKKLVPNRNKKLAVDAYEFDRLERMKDDLL